MTYECFQDFDFSPATLATIRTADDICQEYIAEGLTLTLRQLYYQFVSRDLIPNNLQSYKRLGSIVNNGRLAGLIDWEAIEDRERVARIMPTWASHPSIMRDIVHWYQLDKWADQERRVEVWVEKKALAGVFETVCEELDVPFLACKGYMSQSTQWQAGQRFLENHRNYDQSTVVIHFGDHDPSGIDMTRDNQDRLDLFTYDQGIVEVKRVALNMNQIEEYRPPANPAKLSDSRAGGYIERFGYDSWELDALNPTMLRDLIRKHVTDHRDDDIWAESVAREKASKERLRELAKAEAMGCVEINYGDEGESSDD